MNSSKLNKYEIYGLASNWNNALKFPERASNLITVDSCVCLIKYNYGEESQDDSSKLELPDNWSKDNFDYLVTQWIEKAKLTTIYKVELGIHFDTEEKNEIEKDDDKGIEKTLLTNKSKPNNKKKNF